jgi:hypothetical protein
LLLCYQFAASTWLATGSSPWRTVAAGFAALGVLLVPMLIIERHYQGFGRVVSERRSRWWPGLIFGCGLYILRMQFLLLPQFPNLVPLALAAYAAWLAWDCRPYRWHLLLIAAAALYIAFGSVGAPEGFGWIATRLWALTLADIIAGTLDHVVFVRLMRGRGLAPELSTAELGKTDADTI